MRRHRISAFVLFSAAILIFVVARKANDMRRSHEGKPISYWLKVLENGGPSSTNAARALHEIGSDGIPYLLNLLRAKDLPPPVQKLAAFIGFETQSAESSHYTAMRAFELLHTNAAAAVPGLIGVLQRNHGDSSRLATLGCLSYIGPAAEPALPFIVLHANDPHDLIRHNAIQAIGEIGGQPRVTIPVLTMALSDPVPSVRWCALFALRGYGDLARSAVPEIQKLWTDSSLVSPTMAPDRTLVRDPTQMTYMVGQALWWIAPETTPRALPIESPIPVTENGVTTAALTVDSRGENYIYIPAGSVTPVVAWQHWTNPPPPTLTLFLAQTPDGTNLVHVGDFEVLSVPDARPDITTAYIITGEKIYLAARDNHRQLFLTVRRLTKRT